MVFLIILAFLTIWIMVGNNEREPDWRLAFVQGLILWGAYAILGTEILSLISMVTRSALIALWLLPMVATIIWVWLRLRKGKTLRLPLVYHRDSWTGLILDMLIVLLLIMVLIVALSAPPNSSSVLVNRMSRVAHWAQNHSLAHFATGIEMQNSNAPGADILKLNFYLLSGNDRTTNLVSWITFTGMIVAAASLAEVLGAKANGQRIAAIFAATIPIAITHVTSSMNDIAVSFWIVSAVLMILIYARRLSTPLNLVLAAFAAALAINTKASAFLFLWPFALYMIVVLFQRKGLPKMLLWALMAVMIMGLINGGYFYRNQIAYGQFYRPVELADQANGVRNWKVMVSNLVRNAALHADLPFRSAENWLTDNLSLIHESLGISEDDPRTTLGGDFLIPIVNTSEEASGNPLHALLIVFGFVGIIGLVVLGKEDPDILIFAGEIFFSLLLFCYLLKWQPSNGQLHLPFFVLFAPLVAILFDKLAVKSTMTITAVLLFVYSLPWVFLTHERPVFTLEDRTTSVSVFSGQREALYFATNPEDYQVYKEITEVIRLEGITDIGLDLLADSEEYPFWVMLGAPNSDLRIEWVATETKSKTLLDPDFIPEAVICEDCSTERIRLYSESYQQFDLDGFVLFLAEGYQE